MLLTKCNNRRRKKYTQFPHFFIDGFSLLCRLQVFFRKINLHPIKKNIEKKYRRVSHHYSNVFQQFALLTRIGTWTEKGTEYYTHINIHSNRDRHHPRYPPSPTNYKLVEEKQQTLNHSDKLSSSQFSIER